MMKKPQIEKLPTVHPKAHFNQIYVKGHRPEAIYLKQAKKVLEKTNTIIIHGMASTIFKAIKLAQKIRKQFPYMHYQMKTDSVPTLQKVKKIDESGKESQSRSSEAPWEVEIKERSCVHIIMSKNIVENKEKQ